MPDQNPEEMTYLMGGEIDRGYFHLSVWSEDLDPVVVSAVLDREPSAYHRKGDLSKNGKYHHKSGSWSLDTGELLFRGGEKNCEDQFADWVAAIPGDSNVWAELQKKHEAYVLLAVYMKTWNREFDIRPSTLLELGKRGLRLHIDTYYTPEEELNQTSRDNARDGT